jgi:hypothetical protein
MCRRRNAANNVEDNSVEEIKTWADVVRGSETWSGHPSNMKDM